jgi:D-alanyl-D-alanine carboxypeptidase
VSVPCVEPRAAATTVASCVADLVDESRFASVAGQLEPWARPPAVVAAQRPRHARSTIHLIDPSDYVPVRLLLLALLALQVPPFTHTVSRVTAAQLPYSWHAGCPVSPSSLRRVRLTYWGFDGRAHAGALDVNADAVPDVVHVFARLYAAHFPIRRMRPIDAYRGVDERSLAADNTAAFNCRYAVAPGAKRWSAHAYGRAVDVNPVENPYLAGGRIHPRAGSAYLNRAKVRRGMAVRGGLLVRAFAAVGWLWGGRWSASPDYQHFSSTGG